MVGPCYTPSRKTDPTSESLLFGKKLGPDEVEALGLWAQEIGPSLLIFGRLFMRLSLQYNKAKVGCFLAFIGFSSSLNYEKPWLPLFIYLFSHLCMKLYEWQFLTGPDNLRRHAKWIWATRIQIINYWTSITCLYKWIELGLMIVNLLNILSTWTYSTHNETANIKLV